MSDGKTPTNPDSGEFRTLQKYSQRLQILAWLGSLIVVVVGGVLYVSARPTRAEVHRAIAERAPTIVQVAELRGEIKALRDRYAGIDKRLDRLSALITKRLDSIETKIEGIYYQGYGNGSGSPRKRRRSP